MDIKDLTAYELTDSHEMTDLHSAGYLLKHKKSGAKIAVISNDDENKVFYIGFRTPVDDSTGVPHIVEHTVLCGSDKFPVKDPFVELVKGSMNTFLNAMTYPDKTVYPVASCNDRDFQNLMDVYLDAVFHPNIYKYEEIFKQEGWHYELESEDAPVTINGVVYNEMKGAFSSPEGVLERVILNSLYPDTTYRNESGGDPEVIPELTYEAYLDFHRRYYHPCNSYIYLYGNMDVAEKLEWLDREYLSGYEAIELDSSIKEQKPFSEMKEVVKKYNISSSEPQEDNTYLSYNVSVGNILDKNLYLAFDILDYALLSMPGAPLKKALLDAGIGKDIMGGFDASIYQPIFSIVAKNTNTGEKERFLQVIKDTLREQVRKGIDKTALLAGLNSSEFRYREADFGSYPKGLIYGLQVMDSWLYDEKAPFIHIEALDTYRYLREQIGTGYFEKLVQKYLLDNSHASFVVIEPQRGLNARLEEAQKEKLKAYKDSLSKEQIEALIQDTKHLKQYQEEPSPKEDLEKIPMLKREDLKRTVNPIINEETETGGVKTLFHEMFTNGISYMSLLFDIRSIKEEDLAYVGILKAVLGYMDTADHTYSELANEINLYTGGFASSITLCTEKNGDYQARYEVRMKALYENLPQTASLLKEIVCGTKLSDEKRLYEIIAELKSKLQMKLSQAGHTAAATRAMAGFSSTAALKDLTSGIGFYRVVDRIEKNFEEEKAGLIDRLDRLMTEIFCTKGLLFSCTADREGFEKTGKEIRILFDALPEGEAGAEKTELTLQVAKEGFMDASQVQYVARAGNFKEMGYPYTGALCILKTALNYDYLWINLRVKGGAYGCSSNFMRSGDTCFASYRDPNLKSTNEIYEKIPEYLEHFTVDERDMTKYVIGTISEFDTPLNPDAKGTRSTMAYLGGITEEDLIREREEVLDATEEDIRALAAPMKAVLSKGSLCVIGNEEALKQEKEMFTSLQNLL